MSNNFLSRVFMEISAGFIGVFVSAFFVYLVKQKCKSVKLCCGLIQLNTASQTEECPENSNPEKMV